ncbi:MAG: HD-GYP domain-containing protein [Clostridia bacterium]|nr:HD-GYP domain-containing protein [Clostridia bacterium]
MIFNFMTTVVFTIVMVAVGFDKSSLKYKQKQEEYEKFIRDTSWIDSLNKIIEDVINIPDDEEKVVVAAKELKDVLNSQLPDDEKLTVGVCIGSVGKDGFDQVYSDNIDEKCNYDLINFRYANYNEVNNVFWGDTYFDIVLKKFGAIYSIIHFEGSKNMLNDKISNVIEVLCAQLTLLINRTGDEEKDEEFQVNFLSKLAEVVEAKSGSGKSHLTNVSAISLCICSELGLNEDDVRRIGFASALHDVGKIIIPETILENQGYLSDDEKNIIKFHAEFGGKLLSGVPGEFMKTAAQIAHYHHERVDGSGYYGLKGDEIPLSARITAVADVFDALTSVRSYKTAWSDERAISYLEEYSGTKFDKTVVDAFVKSYDLICELKKGGEA